LENIFTSPLIPKIAIAILNWNGRDYLQKFLPSVIASTYSNKEIVLIDNASTDDSIHFVQKHYPSVTIIRNEANYGFAKGYNEGLKKVDADYFILLNSDVEVEPGWIEPMVDLLETTKTIAACQPKLLQYHQKDLFEYAGAAGGWIDYLGYPFAKGRIFDVCEKDEGQYNTPAPVFWATGAALFIRASVYREAKGFDEYFFAHQEEIDLCWRLQWAGYTIYSCPQSVVYHVGGGTLPKGNSRKVFLNFRNNLVMMAKNLPLGEAIIKIAWRFILDAVSATKSLFAGQVTYFVAVFEAHIAFLGWLFVRKKVSVFPDKKNKNWQGYWKKSVVWQHFILGKKKFPEIVGKKK
jgi:GT2 family glycosyltransferase